MHNELEQILIHEINDKGVVSLGKFIELAMVHPKHGYYITMNPFGSSGDFTTAPEISQMFGEVIGAWIANIWMQMGSPQSFNLIECGAGRGILMVDIMRCCKSIDGFVDAVQIRVIETSDSLRKVQKQALSSHKLTFYNDIDDISVDNPCIILGNEFLDALPIEQLKFGNKGWQQRCVTFNKPQNKFEFIWQQIDKDLNEYLPLKFESNQIYEVSPERKNFIDSCSKIINKSKGAALFIDYGYSKSHYGDTLQAVKNHEFSDVLEDIGQSDITSHIDFDALTRQVKDYGLEVEPIITQRDFLRSLGIELRAKILQQNTNNPEKIALDLERLIGSTQMGELFKVMCFYEL